MLNLTTGSPASGMSLSLFEQHAIHAISSSLCGPSDVNGAAPVVTAPAVPGPGVHIPAIRYSNLDLNDRMVKKGQVVSWRGFRGVVSRVRGGYFYTVPGSRLAECVGAWCRCASVQVVG